MDIISKKYNRKKPLLTIRSDLPKEIKLFVQKLKRKNMASSWVNKAIIEKYSRENGK
jgi:hypothetical protein